MEDRELVKSVLRRGCLSEDISIAMDAASRLADMLEDEIAARNAQTRADIEKTMAEVWELAKGEAH